MPPANSSAVEQKLENQPLGSLQVRVAFLCGLAQMFDGYDINSIGMAAPALRVAAICRFWTVMTRAPCSRARAAVRSVEASSTTRISNSCPSLPAGGRCWSKQDVVHRALYLRTHIALVLLTKPGATGPISARRPARHSDARALASLRHRERHRTSRAENT